MSSSSSVFKCPETVIIPYGLKTLLESVCRATIIENPSHIPHFINQYCCDLVKYRHKFSKMDTKEVVCLFQKNRELHQTLDKPASVEDICTQMLPAGAEEQRTKPVAVELDLNINQTATEGCTGDCLEDLTQNTAASSSDTGASLTQGANKVKIPSTTDAERPEEHVDMFPEVYTTGDIPGRHALDEVSTDVFKQTSETEMTFSEESDVICQMLPAVLSTNVKHYGSPVYVDSLILREISAFKTDVESTEYTQLSVTSASQQESYDDEMTSVSSCVLESSSTEKNEFTVNWLKIPSEHDEVSEEDQEVANILALNVLHQNCPSGTCLRQTCIKSLEMITGGEDKDTANTCSHSAEDNGDISSASCVVGSSQTRIPDITKKMLLDTSGHVLPSEDKWTDAVSPSGFMGKAVCASKTTQTPNEADNETSARVLQPLASSGNTYIQNYGSGHIVLLTTQCPHQCPHQLVSYHQVQTHAQHTDGVSSVSLSMTMSTDSCSSAITESKTSTHISDRPLMSDEDENEGFM
ncbi:uncharacterized protein LOC127440759 isoform X2 [Myxocyprinus asiaticus]|uniref:uncharacterized protein LOC127440759 isoform X2 n=1 Tax=Myxocyprinus asiaticus TaxID=70543 RepID=UPI002223183A|nr:uncharacterized protein LOC127440759 isoform X2 [Myxocyprinus asiaticus]